MTRPPSWARALVAIDRIAQRSARVVHDACESAALHLLDDTQRQALTTWCYDHATTYRPGEQLFRRGLFAWEARALDDLALSAGSHVLLIGAGGGREIDALLARGYRITATEPSTVLLQSAAAHFTDPQARVTLVRGGFDDLDTWSAKVSAPPHLVLAGWGAFAHVLPSSRRREALSALRARWPEAPVLVSYPVETAPARGHAFDLTARAVSAVRANAVTVEAGDHVWAHAGVVHGFVRGEMNDLAAGAGYRVVWERAEPYGHALLTPSTTSPWGGSWPAPGRSP